VVDSSHFTRAYWLCSHLPETKKKYRIMNEIQIKQSYEFHIKSVLISILNYLAERFQSLRHYTGGHNYADEHII
jgi:hypothetical protein